MTVGGFHKPEDLPQSFASEHMLGSYSGTIKTFSTDNMATELDWRNEGAVNPIQDQSSCGSCWAFMAVGTTESAWKLNGGDLYELSVQQIITC